MSDTRGDRLITAQHDQEPATGAEVLHDEPDTSETAGGLTPEQLRKQATSAIARLASRTPAIIRETSVAPQLPDSEPRRVIESLSLPVRAYTTTIQTGKVSLAQVDSWTDEVEALDPATDVLESDIDDFYAAVEAFHERQSQPSAPVEIKIPEPIKPIDKESRVYVVTARNIADAFFSAVDIESFSFTSEEIRTLIAALQAETLLLTNDHYDEGQVDILFAIFRKPGTHPDEVRPAFSEFKLALRKYNKRHGTSQALKPSSLNSAS